MKAYAQFAGVEGKYPGSYKWHKLAEACTAMGVELTDAHSSLGDTLALIRLVKALAAFE